MTSTTAEAVPGVQPVAQVTHRVQFDKSGRVLVLVSLNGQRSPDSVIQALKAMPSVEITATNLRYRVSKLEAWVPTTSVKPIARMPGVLAVVASSPWQTDVGAVTTQGVVQHRVDKIPAGINGKGITVGVISGSYDELGGPIDAASDIRTGDLPGSGNPFGNTQPVVVLQDDPDGNDEGRAMLQIVHDIAPKARLGFAQGIQGELSLADNIRSLAGIPGAPHAMEGFNADVIVDDIIYESEPFFQDGVVAQAVDEVAARGIAYFASGGNRAGITAYDAKPNIVPGVPASWTGTNLDFSDVPLSLYAGGFHNFAPNGRLDIAQTIQVTSASDIDLQWNEPFDATPPTAVGAPLAQGTGTVPPEDDGVFEIPFKGTAGQVVQIVVDSSYPTLVHPHPDVSVTLLDPKGNEIGFADFNSVNETLLAGLKTSGTFTVEVRSAIGPLSGDFVYRVQPVQTTELVRSDYNMLFFTAEGQYIGALDEDNVHTNRPLEIGGLPRGTYQLVIARANVPDADSGPVADRLRYVGFSRVRVQEYFNYLTPVTFGHNSARGAMGVAAYPFYRPFVPEDFTSPGPSTIYFDSNNRRLPTPEVRQKPDFAAMDGGNNTFFSLDATTDDDTFPNFFGTSAAAPHAAAIAALVLDAAGGPGTVKPDVMRRILQTSTFAHDLDPFFSAAVGSADGTVVTIRAMADGNTTVSPTDPNVFTLAMRGPGDLVTFSIDGRTANPTQTPIGIVFDPRAAPNGSPFAIGRAVGVMPANVRASFHDPANPPAVTGQWKALDLEFAPGSFRDGDLLSFGTDRDEADTAGVQGADFGKSADLLGDGVLFPSGERTQGGATFFGKLSDGRSVSGQFKNRLGHGYSPLDGYGFINAEAAIQQVLSLH